MSVRTALRSRTEPEVLVDRARFFCSAHSSGAGIRRRQPDVHEPHRGQSLHPPPVSQGLGNGGAVAVAERGTDPWLVPGRDAVRVRFRGRERTRLRGDQSRTAPTPTRTGTSMCSPLDQRLPLRTTWWYSVSRSIGTRPASVIRRRISATVASCGVSAPAS